MTNCYNICIQKTTGHDYFIIFLPVKNTLKTCLKIKYFISYQLWQFQNFTTPKPCLQHGFARIALVWDTWWCIKSERTRFKHQRPHNSCLLVKHLELARVIYNLFRIFNFQTHISPLFIRVCCTK